MVAAATNFHKTPLVIRSVYSSICLPSPRFSTTLDTLSILDLNKTHISTRYAYQDGHLYGIIHLSHHHLQKKTIHQYQFVHHQINRARTWTHKSWDSTPSPLPPPSPWRSKHLHCTPKSSSSRTAIRASDTQFQ